MNLPSFFPGHLEPGEYTFGMLKPDGYRRGLLGPILKTAWNSYAQLRPLIIQEVNLTVADVEFLYGHILHSRPEVYPALCQFSMSGPCYLMVLRGNLLQDAVPSWRRVMGATNSKEAETGTIRNLWGNPTVIRENVVHGSDSEVRAFEEIDYFFNRRDKS
jgi:nucleoside-diphosphate kinase